MNNVYTHGHHESVLRSHSWRTAENSAGYLLPQLRPGQSLLISAQAPGPSRPTSPGSCSPVGRRRSKPVRAALDITPRDLRQAGRFG